MSLPPKDRFKTQGGQEFNKNTFRRLKDDIEPAEIKDQRDVINYNDAEFQGIEIVKKNVYLEMPTVGYQGFKSSYKPLPVQIAHRKDPFFNINPLKPKLKDQDVT